MKHDDILFENMDKYQYVDFAKKNENYSELEFRAKERPNDSWEIPLVTGNQYRINCKANPERLVQISHH